MIFILSSFISDLIKVILLCSQQELKNNVIHFLHSEYNLHYYLTGFQREGGETCYSPLQMKFTLPITIANVTA